MRFCLLTISNNCQRPTACMLYFIFLILGTFLLLFALSIHVFFYFLYFISCFDILFGKKKHVKTLKDFEYWVYSNCLNVRAKVPNIFPGKISTIMNIIPIYNFTRKKNRVYFSSCLDQLFSTCLVDNFL